MSHIVTLTPGEKHPAVSFECTADSDAQCHLYRDSEDAWHEDQIPETHHERCWIATWFDEPEACCYVGDDADDDGWFSVPPNVGRSDEVSVLWCEDYIEWHFA